MKLDKPLYHGTSKASAIMIVGGYGLNPPIHLTENRDGAIHYARAATAYLGRLAKDEGKELIITGCALFTFNSVPDKLLLKPDSYNPTAELNQWIYPKRIVSTSHFSVEYFPLEVKDDYEYLALQCFAIGMWRR